MKKSIGSTTKKLAKSLAQLTTISAALAQWWSEMDSDAMARAIEEIDDRCRNPILHSHPNAKDALDLIYRKVEQTNSTDWGIDDELRRFLEVLSLWDKQNLLSVQHAIGNKWVSVSVEDPLFLMAAFGAVRGSAAAAALAENVWNMAKGKTGGVRGEDIATREEVPLPYVNALFDIFESEGRGLRSRTLGVSIFHADPDLE